ncbi:MAG: aldo/keto reductase [Desulfurococcales archaeon]|nr:aldo/keto reductase [Desulfurococcales archaeon]
MRGVGRVSRVGLGFWQAGGRLWRSSGSGWVIRVVEEALSRGVNFFDTAEIYGWGRSESLLGEALERVDREGRAVVASKVPPYRTVAYSVARRGVEGVRRRLRGRLDIIQLHWPPPVFAPLCWHVRALERLVLEGMAGAYGLSNFPAPLVEKALECSRRLEPASLQVQYSLAYRSPENRLLPLARKTGLALIAWSPLVKGALAGVARPSDPAQRRDRVFREAAGDRELQEALDEAARRTGMTRAQVALAWLVSKGALPIPGTRRPERVAEIAGAARGLPEDVVESLDRASARYLTRWGRCYRALQWIRLVPCSLQYLALRLSGGV